MSLRCLRHRWLENSKPAIPRSTWKISVLAKNIDAFDTARDLPALSHPSDQPLTRSPVLYSGGSTKIVVSFSDCVLFYYCSWWLEYGITSSSLIKFVMEFTHDPVARIPLNHIDKRVDKSVDWFIEWFGWLTDWIRKSVRGRQEKPLRVHITASDSSKNSSPTFESTSDSYLLHCISFPPGSIGYPFILIDQGKTRPQAFLTSVPNLDTKWSDQYKVIESSKSLASSSSPGAPAGASFVTRCWGNVPLTSAGISSDLYPRAASPLSTPVLYMKSRSVSERSKPASASFALDMSAP